MRIPRQRPQPLHVLLHDAGRERPPQLLLRAYQPVAAATATDATADADATAAADADEVIWSSHALRRWLLGALIAAEALTLVTWYLIHHVMPAAVLALVSRADLRLWC